MDARRLGHDNIEVFLPEMEIYAISQVKNLSVTLSDFRCVSVEKLFFANSE